MFDFSSRDLLVVQSTMALIWVTMQDYTAGVIKVEGHADHKTKTTVGAVWSQIPNTV